MSRGGLTRILDFEMQFGGQDDTKRASMFVCHAIFLVLCGIAVLCVDPLFLYLPVINQDDKCLTLDRKLMITALCLRSFSDMIYVGNIILGYYNRRHGRIGSNPSEPGEIVEMYLRTYIAIDILALIPVPQVLVPIIVSKMRSSEILQIRKFLNACLLLQYVPRILRIYLSWTTHIESSKEHIKKQIEKKISTHIKSSKEQIAKRKRIFKAAFFIYLYIQASHVIGGLWYFFSIQRETACWHKACENHIGCTPSSLKCGRNSENYTFLDNSCPVQTPNTTLIDFGIFLEALQSGTVSSTNILQKLMYCFWWGFRNLSSFGSNLQTSTYFWENCFTVFISIYGLVMFLFFIGNAQIAIEKSEEITQNMKRKKLDIKLWMSRNKLPNEMKKRIISCLHDILKEKKDFDTEKPIAHLSDINLAKEIKLHLCLPLLKEVEILKDKGEYLRGLICEFLKPLYYNEDSYIIREGEPLNVMLFIKQGSVLCFKTSNGENDNGTVSDLHCIEKDGFYGEKLLAWGFDSPTPKLSDLPISTKTVKTLTKVEAFALTANDLKTVLLRHSEAPKHFAQAARRCLKKKEISSKILKTTSCNCLCFKANRSVTRVADNKNLF